jgi:hypothetical protein
LAASADFLLKSSILACCSLSLALKSATPSFHQRARSSNQPRFSAGFEFEAALGGCGCGGSWGEPCGSDCAGTGAVAGGADGTGAWADGGGAVCASAASHPQANSIPSKAPRADSRVACAKLALLRSVLLRTGVMPPRMATPHGLLPKPFASNQANARVICSATASLAAKLGASKVKNAALRR